MSCCFSFSLSVVNNTGLSSFSWMVEMKGKLGIITITTNIAIIIASLSSTSYPNNFQPDLRKTLNPMIKNLKRYDVIIPRVYRTGQQDKTINTTTQGTLVPGLTIEAAQFTFILEIPQKVTSSETRTVEEKKCLYHGFVLGVESHATMTTCGGIRGRVVIEGEDEFELINIYEGEENPFHAEHAIFRRSDFKEGYLHTCGTDESKYVLPKRQARLRHRSFQRSTSNGLVVKERNKRNRKTMLMEPYDSSPTTKYLELYIVNDHSQYLKYNRDFWQVVRRTKEIINIINSIYRRIGIYIILVGMEVWTERNEVPVLGNSSETLHHFVEYKKKNISRRIKHDNAQLIVGGELGQGVIGKAPIRSMCSFESSAAISEDRHDNAEAIATTIAHEMGHNFGVSHDLEHCVCPDSQCIMSSAGGGSDSYKHWSDCSKQKFDDLFKKGLDYCMQDLPEETYMGPTCGNGFKERDEECDCGLEEDCDNPCCLASICKLAENATCATGKCCNLETCQIRAEGVECRSSTGQCDLPEYCDGLQEFCPSNVFKQKGFPCSVGGEDAYCFDGKCETHNSQCNKLWGYTGRVSESLCFEHFNLMGKVHGHCGYNWLDKTFIQCAPQDVMCGMLHCEHDAKGLSYWFSSMTLTMPDTYLMNNGKRIICKAAIMDVGFMPDPGQVADGTKCGPDSMCLNSRCINISYLNFPRCPENCNNNGVCNSIGQCHCNKGWAPPFCKARGRGGSAHSNSPGDRDLPTWIVVLICFICFMIIPAMIISAVLLWRKRKRVKEISAKKYYQCYSSLGRSLGSCLKTSKTPKIVTVAKSEPFHTFNNHGDLKRSNSSTRKVPSNLTRISSFRPEDISKPLLQSSTNNNLILPSQCDAEASAQQAIKPQRPKLPANLLKPSSHSDKPPQEQIYANQITNISLNNTSEAAMVVTANANENSELLPCEKESNVSEANLAFDRSDKLKSGLLEIKQLKGTCDSPKLKYENVDEISLNHKAKKLTSQINNISTLDTEQKPPTSLTSNFEKERIIKSDRISSKNKQMRSNSNEYGNLPLKSKVEVTNKSETPKHSNAGLKAVSKEETPKTKEFASVKITSVAAKGKVSSLREKFQVKQNESDLQNMATKPSKVI